MISAKTSKLKASAVIIALILISSLIYFYKLDNSYFFTDEILYLDSGRQYLKGNFENNMQVPFITKYILGYMYSIADHNVFLLRTPFALMGILSSLLIFLIVKKEFNTKLAIIGFALYLFNPIVLFSTKMGMLEAPMHLFWLLFAYFFTEANKHLKISFFIWSGIFLSLAFASKFTSIALIPPIIVIFLINFKKTKEYLFAYLAMTGITIIGLLLTYLSAIQKLGFKTTYYRISSAFIDGYIGRSEEGKQHIIAGQVYLKSPWWTYLYFLIDKLSIFGGFLYIGGIISGFFNKKNNFLYFWGTFFISNLALFQISGVKSERYLASLLIPAIFIVVVGIDFLFKKFKSAKYIVYFLIFTQIFNTSYKLITQEPDRYNALINNFVSSETFKFSQNKKFYIYGSIRSIRWYVNGKAEGLDMFDYEKNLEDICSKVNIYDYFVIDREEIQRYEDNRITLFLNKNIGNFELAEKYGFNIYKRNVSKDQILSCDN
jgi:4-amino-4-deoxy-L-arabinose transferase-like glycosyltransferase